MNDVLHGNFRKNYFNVEQSEVSFKIISQMEDKILKGAKHLAISSTGYSSSQQKLALQVVYHLNQKHPGLKIGVVTFESQAGHFKDFYHHSEGVGPIKTFYNHFCLIDWALLETIDCIKEEYDVLIWDLPELSTLKNRFVHLDDFFKELHMLTIVSVKKAGSKENEFVTNTLKAYMDYGFDISNLVQFEDGRKRNILERINQMLRRS
jgi:hypothetical protein